MWASSNFGSTWSLISGVSTDGANGGGSSTSTAAAYVDQYDSALCSSTNGTLYIVTGKTSDGTYPNYYYYSVDGGVHWAQSPTDPWPGRKNGECAVSDLGDLFLLAGKELVTSGPIFVANGNQSIEVPAGDVWQLPAGSSTWQQQTNVSPWKARDGPGVANYYPAAFSQANGNHGFNLLVLTGGYYDPFNAGSAVYFSDVLNDNGIAANDVYVSSDNGITFYALTTAAPWPPRDHHRMIATTSGILVIAGGNSEGLTPGYPTDSSGYLNDIWASLDGGYRSLPPTDTHCATARCTLLVSAHLPSLPCSLDYSSLLRVSVGVCAP